MRRQEIGQGSLVAVYRKVGLENSAAEPRRLSAVRKGLANSVRSSLKFLGVSSVSKTLLGEQIRIPLEIGALRPLLFSPTYSAYCPEQDALKLFLGRLHPTDLVYDVGASVGVSALLFSRIARAVVAIEANPSAFQVLQRTVRVNQATNITSVQVAVGARVGEAMFFLQGTSSSLRLDDQGTLRTTVQLETLDTVAMANGETPDAIKLDVEGAELDVLAGADKCLAECRVVYVEVHLSKLPLFGARPEEMWKALEAHGYKEVCQYPANHQGQPDDTRLHVTSKGPLRSVLHVAGLTWTPKPVRETGAGRSTGSRNSPSECSPISSFTGAAPFV